MSALRNITSKVYKGVPQERSFVPSSDVEFIPSTDRQKALQMWRSLENTIENTSATNSAEWLEVWLVHFGDTVPHGFIFGKEQGKLIGATLITNPEMRPRRGKIPVRSLLLGTAGQPQEYDPHLTDLRLLVHPQQRDTFALQIMQTIKRLPWKWDQFLLQGFDPEDSTALAKAGKEAGISIFQRHVRFPVANFEQTREEGHTDVIASLSTNKGRILRNRETLSNTLGSMQGEWAEDIDRAMDIFTELVALNKNRWGQLRGQPGFFHSDEVISYYNELIKRLLPQNKVSLYRLKAGDTTLGCILSIMDSGGIVIGYTSGINLTENVHIGKKDERLANYTPGFLTHTAYMQECMDRGYKQYDFGWGGEKYKVELSNAEDGLDFGFAYQGLKGNFVRLSRNLFYFYRDNRAIEEATLEVGDAISELRANLQKVQSSGRHVAGHLALLGKEVIKHTYTSQPYVEKIGRRLIYPTQQIMRLAKELPVVKEKYDIWRQRRRR